MYCSVNKRCQLDSPKLHTLPKIKKACSRLPAHSLDFSLPHSVDSKWQEDKEHGGPRDFLEIATLSHTAPSSPPATVDSFFPIPLTAESSITNPGCILHR